MTQREKDDVSGTEMTGHEWDGIKELDTPMPRWWLWSYWATVVFSLGYVIAYPAWPLVHGATPGLLGYSSRSDLVQELADAKTAQKGQLEQISALSLEDIRKDPKTLEFAVAGGKAAFRINCIQCHGSGAAGGKGYPNLNDDDWLWGGTLDQIHTTLQHGIRYTADADTRQSLMPAFGVDGILTPEQVSDVADLVLKMSGQQVDAAAADRGALVYKDNCAACHGENGEGNRELGGPRLTDAIAQYVSDKASIVAQINKPRQGVMPAWGSRLDAATIKQLAVYVHGLGGGEMPAP
jgi:cytochrome c oxidase cbb3-type subunit III